MEIVVGVDPGVSGALVRIDPVDGHLTYLDMPSVQVKRGNKLKNEISPQMLASCLHAMAPTIVVLEKVGAMPGQGVSSMFQFGRGVGIVEGVVAGLGCRLEYVTPQRWQKAMGVRSGKDGSREAAARLFPKHANLFARQKDHGRADAALIAAWYVRHGGGA